MENQEKVCQSCGMPLSENVKGTNLDLSLSDDYCKFCYQEGDFVIPDLTLEQQIERLTKIAMERMNMDESMARKLAENNLPHLKRWKNI